MATLANSGVRLAKQMLANSRALEEEATSRVSNPINPIVGRGGAKHTLADHLKHPMKGFGKAEEESESDEETPMKAGRMLREHIESLHGGRYLGHFIKGMSHGGAQTGRYEGEGLSGGGMARMVGSGSMMDAPGGVSGPGFMAAAGRRGRPKKTGVAAADYSPRKAKRELEADDPRLVRGLVVGQLMREKKMTLGQASAYLREHPELLE